MSGKMKTRKWQDKEGNDKWTTEIVAFQVQVLGGQSGGQSSNEGGGFPG